MRSLCQHIYGLHVFNFAVSGDLWRMGLLKKQLKDGGDAVFNIGFGCAVARL